jgi:hypothetical protein
MFRRHRGNRCCLLLACQSSNNNSRGDSASTVCYCVYSQRFPSSVRILLLAIDRANERIKSIPFPPPFSERGIGRRYPIPIQSRENRIKHHRSGLKRHHPTVVLLLQYFERTSYSFLSYILLDDITVHNSHHHHLFINSGLYDRHRCLYSWKESYIIHHSCPPNTTSWYGR